MTRPDASQGAVVARFEALVVEAEESERNWHYMASKQLSDFALVADAGIDGADVLNVGCFHPIDELLFAHRASSWTATDLGEETIAVAERVARRRLSDETFSKLRFEVADGTRLPYPDASFDVTLSMSTVDHVPGPEGRRRFVKEMARVTRPGGRVVLTVPNRWSRGYARRHRPPDAFYEYCFSPPEVTKMVRDADLQIVRRRSSSETPRLAPRLFFSGASSRRPLLDLHDAVARHTGVRFGILAVKPEP